MRCPYCGNEETSVKDSRICDEGESIKRRRLCPNCEAKFTTIERILRKEIFVIKKNGQKVLFDKEKITRSLELCAGKNLTEKKMETITQDIVRRVESGVSGEVKSTDIGQMIMDSLERVDKVSFIRYASVYMKFETTDDFDEFIRKITS